jgi:hypothetical protein
MRLTRSTQIRLILIAALSLESPVGPLVAQAAEPGACVPVGAWVIPGSNKKQDDAPSTLARREADLRPNLHIAEGSTSQIGLLLNSDLANPPPDDMFPTALMRGHDG